MNQSCRFFIHNAASLRSFISRIGKSITTDKKLAVEKKKKDALTIIYQVHVVICELA